MGIINTVSCSGLAEQALLHAKTARDMLASLDGQMEPRDKEEATLTLAVAYWVLGTAQTQLGSLNDAHRNLMEAKKYFDSHSKSSLPNVKLELDIATSIGRLCVKQNKPSNARDYFHKVCQCFFAMDMYIPSLHSTGTGPVKSNVWAEK